MNITAEDLWWTLREEPVSDMASSGDDFVGDIILEALAYRVLAQQAIHALHDSQLESARLRRAHNRLLADYRALRAHVGTRSAA